MGIAFVLGGIVAILIGVFGEKFYEGDALTMSSYKRERRVPNWWGRLLFILGGASFIALGVMALFGSVSWSDN